MSNNIFHDCLGRQINVGDVLVGGYRSSNAALIDVGVVTGFDEERILVTKYRRGRWCGGADRRWWMETDTGNAWLPMDSYWIHGKRCCITGLTQEALEALISPETEVNQ